MKNGENCKQIHLEEAKFNYKYKNTFVNTFNELFDIAHSKFPRYNKNRLE